MLKDPPLCGLGDVCIHLCGPPGPPTGHWARTASTRAAETCSRGVARAPGSVLGGSHPVAHARYTPGIHPAYTRRTPGVHPAYTRHTPGIHPACTRDTPGAHPGGSHGISPGYVREPRRGSRPQGRHRTPRGGAGPPRGAAEGRPPTVFPQDMRRVCKCGLNWTFYHPTPSAQESRCLLHFRAPGTPH